MNTSEKFTIAVENRKKQYQKISDRIETLKSKLTQYTEGSRGYEVYSQQIRDTERNLRNIASQIEYMRPNDEQDEQLRLEILKKYPKLIKEIFPDGYPIVFHGTNNIGTVHQILKSGGLLTPEQRGESMTSFASAIDVTYKDNIRVSCEFADAGYNSFMPYGAIFAFKPEDDEIERAITTGDSSEVAQGVNGVNFKNEPNRLYGIITTRENIDKVKLWCKQYSIDANKVFTHEDFISYYKKLTANIVFTL